MASRGLKGTAAVPDEPLRDDRRLPPHNLTEAQVNRHALQIGLPADRADGPTGTPLSTTYSRWRGPGNDGEDGCDAAHTRACEGLHVRVHCR